MDKKIISVICPCYMEEGNVEELYRQVVKIFDKIKDCDYELIFIDNNSSDRTALKIKKICLKDKKVKLIVNAKNFGQIRSPYYGLLQGSGEATILIAADFQDPVDTIAKFISEWQKGNEIVIGIKSSSEEPGIMFALRKLFYRLMRRISRQDHIQNFTGFGIYDRKFIEVLKKIDDPYPYFRGLVCELGTNIKQLEFKQAKRRAGKTSNNFFTLYEMTILAFVNNSIIPIRIASFLGFVFAGLSFLVALAYLVYKIIYWQEFSVGLALLIIGLFFFASVQLVFIGVIGEYVGAILTQVKKRPLVIEKERVNF